MLPFFNKILPLLFLSFLTVQAIAQSDTGYLSLLHSEIRLIQPHGTIYYAEKPGLTAGSSFISSVNDDFNYIKKHGLAFSAAEKKYIIRQLKKSGFIHWPDSLFPQSKRMGGDTIIQCVDRRGKVIRDSLIQAANYAALAKYSAERPWAFFFGNSIYLRHNTILLCYFMYYQTSAGENAVRIYRKENNQWKPWDRMGGGAW